MTYDEVYSYNPPIIITEDDGDGYWHVYIEGELVGIAYDRDEAELLAEETFDSIIGEFAEEPGETI